MSKVVTEIVDFAAAAALIAIDVQTGGYLDAILRPAAISFIAAGIGTLLTRDPLQGVTGSVRNPITAWQIAYGKTCVNSPTLVFLESTGDSNKYLHMVYMLAAHPIEAVDYVRLNGIPVILNGSGDSYTPLQNTVNISSISRTNDVVTVVCVAGINADIGWGINIVGVTTDTTLNGAFLISWVSGDGKTFTYTCGGSAVSITSQGHITTAYPDWQDKIHCEFALGTQTTAPFPTLLSESNGKWTSSCILQGHSAAYVRLGPYDQTVFAAGVPSITFLIRGKNDILDPRTGTTGYTANAALCIADFMSNQTYGFRAAYHTDLPDTPLIAAANVCDESVALAASGSEPRYEINGSFSISLTRGTILQNLLTACAGRIAYQGGQWIIQPAAWPGIAANIGDGLVVVPGTAIPWSTVGGTINASISATGQDGTTGTPPVKWPVAVSPGDVVKISVRRGKVAVGSLSVVSLYGPLGNVGTIRAGTVAQLNGWTDVGDGSLCGAFVDNAGVVKAALDIGSGGSFTAPAGTTAIQFGINDLASWSDNLGSFVLVVSSSGATDTMDTEAQAAAAPVWRAKLSSRDLYNGVKGIFISPANGWNRSDFPAYAQDPDHGYSSDAWLTQDGGERRWKDIQLPFTTSVSCAQRLAKIELLRSRMQGLATLTFNLAAYNITPLDVLQITLPPLGWQRKLMEVVGFRLTQSAQDNTAPLLLCEMDVNETDSSVYDWSTSDELNIEGFGLAALPQPSTVNQPTGVTATSSSSTSAVNASGTAASQILVTWVVADGYAIQTAIQFQKVGDTGWTSIANVAASADQAYIAGVSDGDNYNVRVASVNAAGAYSPWVQVGPVTVSGAASTIAPGGLSAGGASTGSTLVYNGSAWVPSASYTEAPTGTLNGTNVTFTLSHTPISGTLRLDLNGMVQRPSVDYTISGATITYTVAPKSTDWHEAEYTA